MKIEPGRRGSLPPHSLFVVCVNQVVSLGVVNDDSSDLAAFEKAPLPRTGGPEGSFSLCQPQALLSKVSTLALDCFLPFPLTEVRPPACRQQRDTYTLVHLVQETSTEKEA